MEEIDIGKLTIVKNANLQDFVLMFTKSGALVIVPVENLRQKTEGGIAPSTNVIVANGIRSQAGNDAILQNNAQDGVVVKDDGSILIIPGASNKITLGKSDTVIEPALLTKVTADGSYMPFDNLVIRVSQTAHPFADGTPARWNGVAWVKPGAPGVIPSGATSPADDWSGIVRWVNTNTFDLIVAGYVNLLAQPVAGSPTPAQFVAGTNYWNATLNGNAGAWTTTRPTAFGSFEGKVVANTATKGLILPFKRRSAIFRPVQIPQTVAGQTINDLLFAAANKLFCSTGMPAEVWLSNDNGDTWSKVATPSAASYNHVHQMRLSGSKVYLALSKNTDPGSGQVYVNTINSADGSALTAYGGALPWASTRRTRGTRTIEDIGGYRWAFTIDSNWLARADSTNNFAVTNDIAHAIYSSVAYGSEVISVGGNGAAGTAALYKSGFSNTAPIRTFAGQGIARCVSIDGTRIIVGCDTNVYFGTIPANTTAAWNTALGNGVTLSGVSAINDVIAYSATKLFAATNIGIFVSNNSGTDWMLIMPGNATALALGTGNRLIAAIDGVLWVYMGN